MLAGMEDSEVIQEIVRIEYRTGMLVQGQAAETIPVVKRAASKFPPQLWRELRETDILNCGGIYGQMDATTPSQFDQLRIYLTDDTVEVIVFNRAESLKNARDSKILRIDRFLGVLDQFLRRKRKGGR